MQNFHNYWNDNFGWKVLPRRFTTDLHFFYFLSWKRQFVDNFVSQTKLSALNRCRNIYKNPSCLLNVTEPEYTKRNSSINDRGNTLLAINRFTSRTAFCFLVQRESLGFYSVQTASIVFVIFTTVFFLNRRKILLTKIYFFRLCFLSLVFTFRLKNRHSDMHTQLGRKKMELSVRVFDLIKIA